jgi:hypothetical protein
MTTRTRRLAQTLAEVMLAVVFLATGGLVIYSAAVRSMQDAGWEADRVFAQGMLRDLIEVYSHQEYCKLEKGSALVPGVDSTIPLGTSDEASRALAIANGAGFQDAFDDEKAYLRPLQYPSFFKNPDTPKTKAEMDADPLYKEYRDTLRRIDAKRIVLFQKDTSGGKTQSAVITCYVFFKAANGASVTLKGSTVIFNPDDTPCP